MNKTVIIPHVPLGEPIEQMLDKCVKSLSGYQELVMVINDAIGYGAAFNRGLKHAKGDFIICVSNDTVLKEGSLDDLCDPEAVTFTENAQWGCFFCLPRWVYEKIGGFDESFGLAYHEDDDYLMRLEDARIPLRRVRGVKVDHVGGATIKALGKEQEASEIGKKRHIEKWGDRHAVIPEL